MQNTWKSHRFFLHLVILGLCLCYVYQLPAQSNEQTSHKEITILADTYLSALTELKQFNGVVLLQKEGEIILNKAYIISLRTKIRLYTFMNLVNLILDQLQSCLQNMPCMN